MTNESRRRLSPMEQRELQTQLELFWYGCSPQESNAYANVLIFLVLAGEDVIAPAAFEVVVYDIIKNPNTPLPWCVDQEEEFRTAVAAAVMEKLRAKGVPQGQSESRLWHRLVSYQRDHDANSGNFRAWVKKVAYRVAIDMIRRHPMSVGSKDNRRWVSSVPLEDWDANSKSLDDWNAQTPLPLRIDIMRSLVAVAGSRIHLSEQDWDLLCLRVDAGLGFRQIAERIGCTPEAARKRLARLRKRLREHTTVHTELFS